MTKKKAKPIIKKKQNIVVVMNYIRIKIKKIIKETRYANNWLIAII